MPTMLVTGAAGGIGSVVVQKMVSEGWTVIATDTDEACNKSNLSSSSDALIWVPANIHELVASSSALKIFESKLRKVLDKAILSAIVHIAASQRIESFATLSISNWQETLAVNVLGPVVINNLLLENLIETHGSIVHISSIHSTLTKPGFTAYATSKAALSGLTRAMAVELGDRVRVNAIEPAAIRTPMLEAGFNDHPELLSLLEKHHPTKSIGSPEDVARAVSFLLDPANTFLNGCVLELGGGIHARLHDPA